MPVTPLNSDRSWTVPLKYGIATLYVLAPLAYWAYNIFLGTSPDMMIWVLMFALMLSSAYMIFGEERVNAALDQAQDMTGQDSDKDQKN